MAFKKIVPLMLVMSVGTSCEYTFKRDAPSLSFTLDVNDLVVETPATAKVADGEFQLIENGTGDWGCKYTGVEGSYTGSEPSPSSMALSSTSTFMGVPFSLSVTTKPKAVVLRLKKNASPNANAIVNITAVSNGNPSLTIIEGSTGSVSTSLVSTADEGDDVTFAFTERPTLSASTNYAVLLRGVTGSGTLNGSNNISWRIASDGAVRKGCTEINLLQNYSDSGPWLADTGAPYFYLVLPKYHNSGSGYWIKDGSIEVDWDMSSFMVTENPGGDKPGTALYSIGAGSDPTTTSFIHTNLTLNQVRSLTGIKGRYLYVRVLLTSTNSNFENAGTASGSISSL